MSNAVTIAGQPRRRIGSVGMSPEDRAREFRRARRNTLLVRSLRLALPAAAVGLLSIYGLFLRQTLVIPTGEGDKTAKVSFRPSGVSRNTVKMADPSYEGFGDDGSRYVVAAKSATMSMARDKPVLLDSIDGKLYQTDDTITRLVAQSGTYNQTSGKLTLSGGIDIESTSGLTAKLTSADVDPKAGIITSKQPAEVNLPTGKVVGQTLWLNQKTRTVTFASGVRAVLRPQARPTEGASFRPKTALPALSADPNAPVVVTANTLTVEDPKTTAQFKTNVLAVQGDSQLRAAILTIKYLRNEPPKGAAKPVVPGQSGRVQSLTAEDNVVITSGTNTIASARATFEMQTRTGRFDGGVRIVSGPVQSAEAKALTFNQAAQTAVLIGEVTVAHGRNRLSGGRLSVDQARGKMVLTTPGDPDAGVAPGRISARFYRTSAPTPGRNATAPQPARSAAAPKTSGWSFRADPAAPIDIAANRLRVDDNAKVATFEGNVTAAQGVFRLSAATLTAKYTGSNRLMASADAGQDESGANASGVSQDLTRIRAEGNVVVLSENDQRARGDWAVFDVKANTITV
ncbi:MAG: LPS export ABC transporter periplasmic protein LptC, partial [Pseudomonadota bacterium]